MSENQSDDNSNMQVHALADVEPGAEIGEGTRIWRWTLVRAGARIGPDCRIGSGVVIDRHVTLGRGCKIADGAKVYGPLTAGDYVFIGPNAVLCNDWHPTARNVEWSPPAGQVTLLESGCVIGAGAVVLPGVTVGEDAVVGAGTVVTRSVARESVVLGNPARAYSRES